MIHNLQLINQLPEILLEFSQQGTIAHQAFLKSRQQALQQMSELVREKISNSLNSLTQALPDTQQLVAGASAARDYATAARDFAITAVAKGAAAARDYASAIRQALFGPEALEEFARGSIVKCFGLDFRSLLGRRIPRIPNGDLKLVSRVLSILGERLKFDQPATIIAEYDVPAEAWYFRDSASSELPYAILLEIALQPCGFLSAYMGTMLLFGERNLYFRNLDGRAQVLNRLDTRGQTLLTKARLLSTAATGDTAIQKFEFETSCQGTPLYRGETVFGFFDEKVMARQVGLANNQASLPLCQQPGHQSLAGHWLSSQDPASTGSEKGSQNLSTALQLHRGKLNLLDEIFVAPGGGDFGQGYVYAHKAIRPDDWFFACHFYEDPVMPGSLGIEAILQALQVFAYHQNLGKGFRSPRFSLTPGREVVWKYRGQITPHSNRQMKLEAHIHQIEHNAGQVTLLSDANLWADDIRIYQIKNAAVSIMETA